MNQLQSIIEVAAQKLSVEEVLDEDYVPGNHPNCPTQGDGMDKSICDTPFRASKPQATSSSNDKELDDCIYSLQVPPSARRGESSGFESGKNVYPKDNNLPQDLDSNTLARPEVIAPKLNDINSWDNCSNKNKGDKNSGGIEDTNNRRDVEVRGEVDFHDFLSLKNASLLTKENIERHSGYNIWSPRNSAYSPHSSVSRGSDGETAKFVREERKALRTARNLASWSKGMYTGVRLVGFSKKSMSIPSRNIIS